MLNIVMSRAAAGLLRALLHRGGEQRHRILLTEIRSVDWHSLTLEGERHAIHLRISGPDAELIVTPFLHGIEDAEFAIPGQILADIALARGPERSRDGSVALELEALTVVE
jgi:hypothetical protein